MKTIRYPILYIAIVMAASLFVNNGLVARADDPGLIQKAMNGIPVTPDWSPLFIELINIVSDTQGGLSYKLLFYICTVPLAFIFYFLARDFSGSDRNAFFISILVLVSPISPILASFSSIPSSIAIYPGIFLFLLGSALTKKGGSHPFLKGFFALPFAMASLFRPEFLWSVVAYVVINAFFIMREGGTSLRNRIVGIIYFSTGLATTSAPLYVKFGLPIANAGRMILAFGQHYSVRFCDSSIVFCAQLHPWADWKSIFGLSFPTIESMAAIFVSNPNGFISHITLNLTEEVFILFSLGYFTPFFLSNLLYIKALSLLFGTGALFIVLRRLFLRFVVDRFLIFILFSMFPFLLTQTMLFPRIHYSAMPIYCLALLMCFSKTRNLPE